jgi:UDPglucose 6-dehydrogenase
MIETDIASAELAKHACNAFLALKISFTNALARVSELSGANVELVTKVMGQDDRIGAGFLKAGLGFGGSCFPKDLQAFRRLSADLGYEFPILDEIARINDEAVHQAFEKIRGALWNIEGKTVALLGLAFKPGTDDTRFAPALSLGKLLLEGGADLVGYDPLAGPAAQAELSDLRLASDPYEAVAGAHCVVVCTEWDEVRGMDLERMKNLMSYPIVVDGRNVFDRSRMAALGFAYYPTGMAPVGIEREVSGSQLA